MEQTVLNRWGEISRPCPDKAPFQTFRSFARSGCVTHPFSVHVCNRESSMPAKYLSCFQKPLLDDLVNGRWLPVIGAGMSLNAVLPAKMPLRSDVSKQFAEGLVDYSPTGVLDAISAHEHEFGRAPLIERLAEILHLDKAQPGPAHKEFCSLPFEIVCPTNFDFLLEMQYDRERQDNRTVHPVVDEPTLH
jgi:hypothetical protein